MEVFGKGNDHFKKASLLRSQGVFNQRLRKVFLQNVFTAIQSCNRRYRSPYVTPELNNKLQCNVGNMLGKFTSYFPCIYKHCP